MPIHSIKRTKQGRWAILFRDGGNALFSYKGEWVEAPVLKNGDIDDHPEAEGELVPVVQDWMRDEIDDDQRQAIIVLAAFREAMFSTEDAREGHAPWPMAEPVGTE